MKRIVVATTLAASLFVAGSSFAEEAFHKFRISVGVNNWSTQDSLRTNADNTSLYRNPFGGITVIDDPRPDAASKNENGIKDDFYYNVAGSYGMFKWKWGELTLDTSVGYFQGKLGDLEVAGQFIAVDPPRISCGEATRFHLVYIPVGDVTEVPVRLGGTVRFRPRASGGPFRGMSPFLSAGVGYMFNKIEATQEFLTFSNNVRHSVGYSVKPDPNTPGGSIQAGPIHKFKAAEAEAPDTFEYHASGGIEFPIRKGLFLVFEVGWTWANEEIDITIDGKHNFGTAIPQGFTDTKFPVNGLPVTVLQGGLIDYGSGFPVPRENEACKFKIGRKDGLPDLGDYFVQGGTLSYNASQVGFSLRYQF